MKMSVRMTQCPPRLSNRTLLAAIAAINAALNQKNIRMWYVGQKLSAIHRTKPPLRSVSSRM
jgi:hypothetical protein